MVQRYTIQLNGTTFKDDIMYNECIAILFKTINDFKNTNQKITITTTSKTKKEVWHNCGVNHNLTNVYDVERITINIEH